MQSYDTATEATTDRKQQHSIMQHQEGSDESGEGRKKAAATVVRVGKRSKKIAKDCLEIAEAKGKDDMKDTIEKGLLRRSYKHIDLYKAEIAPFAAEEIQITAKNTVGATLMKSKSVREGMFEMIEVCLSIIDLFCLCNVDMFTGEEKQKGGGLTKYIQQVTSK